MPHARNAVPSLVTYESTTPGLSDKSVGNKIRAILNYEVIERTKSFTTIKVHYVNVIDTARRF